MIQLSVIIPIYKVEKYLRQCVDSVINQKIENLELILVDDGSPDQCPQICDEYAEKYDFIKVIHKPNGGLSSARNTGIRAAAGEYLIFMDSDDWWNPDVDVNAMFAEVSQRPNVEMFLFSSLDYIEGAGYFKRTEHGRLDGIRVDTVEHYYEDLLNNGNLEISAATKILKRSFLIENDLFFKEGIVCEDSEWIVRLLRVLSAVCVLNEPLYICRLGRADSITNTVGLSNLKDMLGIIESSLDYYADARNSSERKNYELCYCAYLWFCALGLANGLPKQDYQELRHLLKATASVCAYSNSPKTRASYFVYRVFGLEVSRFSLGLYLKLKHKMNLNKKKQGAA